MTSVSISRRRANLALFVLFLILAVAGYSVTSTFPSPLLPGYPGSAMFPRLVLVTMGAICLFGIARGLLTAPTLAAEERIKVPIGAFAAVIAALLAFTALLLIFGTEIAVFAFIAGGLFIRTRRVVVPVLAGLAAVAVVYFVFVQALSVHLPLQFLPRYLFL